MNPRKFQFVILGKSLQRKYCVTIGKINVKESNHVELLGRTIDKHLSLKKYIENLCQNANYKLFALIRKRFSACLYSVQNIICLSRHEQVCLMRLHFERYLSQHRAT